MIPENLVGRGLTDSGDVVQFIDREEWQWPLEEGIERTDHRLNLVTQRWERIPRSDGKAIAAATSEAWRPGQSQCLFGKPDGTVVISDGTKTDSIRLSKEPVEPLLLSPKGRYVLSNIHPRDTNGEASYALLWDREAGQVIGRFPRMNQGQFREQAISPDERFMAYLGEDFTVILWNIPQRQIAATLRGHTWNVYGVEFSQDSRMLASFDWEAVCRLWNVEEGKPAEPHLLRGHRSGVFRATFSSDGRTIATGSDDNSVKLWSVATGQEVMSRMDRPGLSAPTISAKQDRFIQEVGSEPDVRVRVLTLPTLAEIDQILHREQSVRSANVWIEADLDNHARPINDR